MAKLAETSNVTIASTRDLNGTSYYEVSAIADHNCALNAFGLVLIDLVKRGQLRLSEQNQNTFLQAIQNNLSILQKRLALYREEISDPARNAYTDLADGLNQFIEFMQANPTYLELLNHVKAQVTREEIAVLHVALAPALRQLGVDLYEEKLSELSSDDELDADAQNLRQDGVDAGEEILSPLAHDFFNVNLVIHDADRTVVTADVIKDAPTVALLHSSAPEHWDALIATKHDQGLIADLKGLPKRDLTNIDKLAEENQSLTLFMQEKAEQLPKNKVLTKVELQELTAVVMQTGDNILKMNKVAKKLSADIEAQARELAEVSESLRLAVQAKMDTSDERLAAAGLKTFEKEMMNLAPAINLLEDSDEALARALQNAEILDFLNKRYDTFARLGKGSDAEYAPKQRHCEPQAKQSR